MGARPLSSASRRGVGKADRGKSLKILTAVLSCGVAYCLHPDWGVTGERYHGRENLCGLRLQAG